MTNGRPSLASESPLWSMTPEEFFILPSECITRKLEIPLDNEPVKPGLWVDNNLLFPNLRTVQFNVPPLCPTFKVAMIILLNPRALLLRRIDKEVRFVQGTLRAVQLTKDTRTTLLPPILLNAKPLLTLATALPAAFPTIIDVLVIGFKVLLMAFAIPVPRRETLALGPFVSEVEHTPLEKYNASVSKITSIGPTSPNTINAPRPNHDIRSGRN